MGGDRNHYGKQQYELPDNVVHLECHYLMDNLADAKPKPSKGKRTAFDTQRKLHDQFRSNEPVPAGVLSQALRDLGRKAGISKEDFLYSQESWQMIDESYRQYCTEPSFVDYFWTIRVMHAPLFQIAEIARNIPATRTVHAISTGYAGLLGAMLNDIRGVPFILTEHGIYTKERKIDLSQAEWIRDVSDKVSTNLNDQLGYIRQLWIRFFESLGRLAYQQADPIISLYLGNQQRVSQPRELPPQLLSEPGVNLSAHRAPIAPTENAPRPHQCANMLACFRFMPASHEIALILRPRKRLYFRIAHRMMARSR